MSPEPASLSPSQLAPVLASTADFIRGPGAVEDQLLRWHPAPGEWCIKEVIGHLIEAERRGYADRVHTILEQDQPALIPWDQSQVARERRDCERPIEILVGEFLDLRQASIGLVRALTPEQLTRGAQHPEVGRLTIDDLIHEWVHHDADHVRQALANLQSLMWPAMGNAQRFSDL